MNGIFAFSAVLLIAFTGCHSTTRQQTETVPDATQTATLRPAILPEVDSLSLDLRSLKAAGKLTTAQPVQIPDDPVFHRAKSYRAISLRQLLEQYTRVKHLNLAQTQVVFECEDGYSPSMSLELLLKRTPYLATSDLDAPKGQEWVNAVKGSEVKKVAPFYVVYPDVKASEHDYKWPYNLVRISLVETAREYSAIYPRDDDTAVKGFGLFLRNCITCHALNGIGGTMGPELNYPKSVIEYWRSAADVKAFVKAPGAYRQNCKMPAITYLSDAELDELMEYLTYMASHKKKGA